jgi:hypothetical protein
MGEEEEEDERQKKERLTGENKHRSRSGIVRINNDNGGRGKNVDVSSSFWLVCFPRESAAQSKERTKSQE